MRLTKQKLVESGIPSGYAVAWNDFDTETVICYPVGIHFIAGWLRDRWYDLSRPYSSSVDERMREFVRQVSHEAYERGFRNGFDAHILQKIEAEARINVDSILEN